jgi:hypothetical protein
MAKKLTQVKRTQAYMAAGMYQVMNALGYSKATYETLRQDWGEVFLWVYLREDMESFEKVVASRAYWGWWRLHWYIREKEFLLMLENDRTVPLQVARWQYKCLHHPHALARGVTRNSQVLEDSYWRDLAPKLK